MSNNIMLRKHRLSQNGFNSYQLLVSNKMKIHTKLLYGRH